MKSDPAKTPQMTTIPENLRVELQALTFPVRRKVRYRLHALANDALSRVGKEPRFDESFAEQWRRILSRSGGVLSALPPAGAPRVLFGSMFGGGFPTRAIDAILAVAMRLRGASSMVLACNASLPACEWNVFGNFEPSPGPFGPEYLHYGRAHTCNACTLKLHESHTVPGLEQLALSEFAGAGDVLAAQGIADSVELDGLRSFVYRDLPVGEHAYASLLKATLRGVPLDDERTRWIGRRCLASAITLVNRGERLFDRTRPDRFVVADGVYVSAAPLCSLARRRGIHVAVHGNPYRKRSIWVSHDESYHRALINAKNAHWEALEMTPERVRAADEYLASKHSSSRDYTSFHIDSIQDPATIRRELGLDDRPIVGLFTNILWDAQIYYRLNVFSNMLEWMFETIRAFEKRPDLQLAIRIHPGEAPGSWPTNQPILPEIERAFPRLPENVKIVRPESKVSSYVLGEMSRAALVYGARVGVELVMLGTPVVVAGEAFMRGKGFTIDPASREEYFAVLDGIADIERASAEARARARKWYYYYFFRLMMPFPFYTAGVNTAASLDFESLDALLPGRSPTLDLVCQGIADATTRFEWDEYE